MSIYKDLIKKGREGSELINDLCDALELNEELIRHLDAEKTRLKNEIMLKCYPEDIRANPPIIKEDRCQWSCQNGMWRTACGVKDVGTYPLVCCFCGKDTSIVSRVKN